MRAEPSERCGKELRTVNRYLNDVAISNELKHKIRTHYFHKHLIEQKHDVKDEETVIKTITPSLKISLMEETNTKIVRKCSVLEKFTVGTFKKLSESIKRVTLAPEYILYSRKSTDRKLWFIENGTV
jgi:hypothetical protein